MPEHQFESDYVAEQQLQVATSCFNWHRQNTESPELS
jgi:hypothetical protein